MGVPEMAPHTPPPAPRSSQGLDRAGGSAVPVVTEPRVHVHDVELVGLERDVLVLTAEERRWGRRRVTTRAGRALALALPTGSVLVPGDGLFPAGGFAHSFGLETYVQEGRVDDAAGLEAFVVAHLEGSAGPCDAVAVAHATRIAARDDVEEAVALDARLDAMKCVPEFRAASRQMGRQTLRATSALDDDRFLAELLHAVEDGLAPGHHALAFAVPLARAGADAERAAVAYLYSTATFLVGAGLRLIALGQVQGQRLLARLRPRLVRLGSEAAAREVDDMWSFNPGLELAGLRHATLDRRLFRS